MVLLQIRLRQRQVRLHHLHRRMPQHHLQAPGVAPVSQVIDRKRMSESMHVRLNYSLALCIKPPPHGNLLDLSKERRIFELRRSFVLSGRRDLNPGPHGPEPCALAGLSYAPHGEIITDLLPLGKKTNRLEIIGHGFDRITRINQTIVFNCGDKPV